MKKKKFLLPLLLATMMCVPASLNAQITIGSANPPSEFSLLDLDASNVSRGLHLPRLSTADRDALTVENNASLAVGLMIYNTDNNCIEFWNSSQWISLCASDKSTIPDIIGAWIFNDVTISLNGELSQQQHNCIINYFGSVEEFISYVTEYLLGLLDYPILRYDETNGWVGRIIDGELFWDEKTCWRWVDETETGIYIRPIYDDYDDCSDDFISEILHIELSDNKLYLILKNQEDMNLTCPIRFTWKYELIPFSLPSTPSSSVRSLQQRSAPSRMHLPFIGK